MRWIGRQPARGVDSVGDDVARRKAQMERAVRRAAGPEPSPPASCSSGCSSPRSPTCGAGRPPRCGGSKKLWTAACLVNLRRAARLLQVRPPAPTATGTLLRMGTLCCRTCCARPGRSRGESHPRGASHSAADQVTGAPARTLHRLRRPFSERPPGRSAVCARPQSADPPPFSVACSITDEGAAHAGPTTNSACRPTTRASTTSPADARWARSCRRGRAARRARLRPRRRAGDADGFALAARRSAHRRAGRAQTRASRPSCSSASPTTPTSACSRPTCRRSRSPGGADWSRTCRSGDLQPGRRAPARPVAGAPRADADPIRRGGLRAAAQQPSAALGRRRRGARPATSWRWSAAFRGRRSRQLPGSTRRWCGSARAPAAHARRRAAPARAAGGRLQRSPPAKPARWPAARPAGMRGRGCWRRRVSRSTPTRWRCGRRRGRRSRAASDRGGRRRIVTAQVAMRRAGEDAPLRLTRRCRPAAAPGAAGDQVASTWARESITSSL